MTKKIGFIGLGNMGAHMCRRLQEAGNDVVVFDVRQDAMAPAIARGGAPAGSPAEVASAAETVLVSLPTPDIARQVATGANGVIEGTAVKTYIDLSTNGSRVAVEIAAALAQKGIGNVDSPVSGGVGGADRGTLAVMVSAPRDLFERVKPILDNFGKVFFVGDKPGMGQTMKLVNNLLSATTMAASCEAVVMGTKAGLDPDTIIDVINAGSGRSSATEDKFPRAILPRTFDYGFQTALLYKDVRLGIEEAESLGVPMWVGNATKQLWSYAMSQGGGNEDITTLIKYVEQWAGVEVRGKDAGNR